MAQGKVNGEIETLNNMKRDFKIDNIIQTNKFCSVGYAFLLRFVYFILLLIFVINLLKSNPFFVLKPPNVTLSSLYFRF